MDLSNLAMIFRKKPNPIGNGKEAEMRCSPYGDQIAIPLLGGMQGMSDEGSYFTFTNPTPMTAITDAVQNGFTDTKPTLVMRNRDAPAGDAPSKRIYLDFLRFILNTAPASATAAHCKGVIDYTDRYTSGGSQLVPVNPNGDETALDAVADIRFGAITAAAASASQSRLVHRSQIRSVIPVVGDSYLFVFGPIEKAAAISDIAGTTAKVIVMNAAPVILGPGQSYLHYFNFPSNATTAAQWEVEGGYWVR